jgi:stringent starvation protein B
MAPTARLPPKKDVALALLEQASMYIHLDPRADTVKVPAWFKKQPQLVLQVGLNMAVPIPDLHVDEQGLSCTLSFNRSPFYCMIPWPAVFALVGENGQAMVWAEDVPAEVAAQAQAQKAPPEKPRTHLRSVGEAESAPPPEAAKAPEASEKKSTAKPRKTVKVAKPETASAKAKAKPEGKAAPAKVAKAGASKASKAAEPKPNPEPKAATKKPAAAARTVAEPTAAMPAKTPPKPEPARAATDISKPKRELPPYLRVVK